MTERYIGGLQTPGFLVVSAGLIEFLPSSDELTFRLRFGLWRVFPPWIIRREEVRSVRLVAGRFWRRLEVRDDRNRMWEFISAYADLGQVANRLRLLGYPVFDETAGSPST